MPQILEQGISVDSHNRNHRQWDQRYSHNDDPNGRGHGDPLEFGIPDQNHQSHCLNGIAGFHHAPQQLAGVGVVGRDDIYIIEFLFFHGFSPPSFLECGNVQDILHGNVSLGTVSHSTFQNRVRFRLLKSFQEGLCIVLSTFRHMDHLAIDEMDSIVCHVHFYITFRFDRYMRSCRNGPIAEPHCGRVHRYQPARCHSQCRSRPGPPQYT